MDNLNDKFINHFNREISAGQNHAFVDGKIEGAREMYDAVLTMLINEQGKYEKLIEEWPINKNESLLRKTEIEALMIKLENLGPKDFD